MSGQGRESYIQVGTEPTNAWGTMVAATTNLEIIEDSFAPLVDYIDDPSLFNGFSARDLIQAGLHGGGSLKLRANYEGQIQHLRAIMGGYSSAVPGGATGVRDHLFVEGDQRSLSLRSFRGKIPSTLCWHLPGTRYSQMVFEVKSKELSTFTFDGIAKDMIPGQALTGSMSFPAVLPVKFNHAITQIADGSGDIDPLNLQGIKVTVSRPLDLPMDVGSLNMQEPDLSEMMKTTWEFTYRFKSLAAASVLRAGTVASLGLVMQDPALIGSGGTFHSEYEFSSIAAKCVGWSAPITGYGRIIQTATWQAFYDPGTATSLSIRNRNTQAALA